MQTNIGELYNQKENKRKLEMRHKNIKVSRILNYLN